MAKYLYLARYSTDGAKGVVGEGGTGRRAAIEKLAQSMGGQLEAFYFAFGETDAYVIVDLPDNVSAAAVALAVNSSGGASVNTVILMTPEEVDAAAKMHPMYRAPGR